MSGIVGKVLISSLQRYSGHPTPSMFHILPAKKLHKLCIHKAWGLFLRIFMLYEVFWLELCEIWSDLGNQDIVGKRKSIPVQRCLIMWYVIKTNLQNHNFSRKKTENPYSSMDKFIFRVWVMEFFLYFGRRTHIK